MPRTWQDRIVQYPKRFTMVNNGDGTYTFTPSPGTITQAGTPTNATYMNGIETDITNNAAIVTSHLADDVKHVFYAVTTGVANTYVATLSPVPTAYVDGMAICVKINIASTGSSTINVNGLGAKTILDSLGNAITSGGLKLNTPYTLRYESVGGNFIVQGKGGGGNLVAGDLRLSKTATGDSGPVVGTLDLTNLLALNIITGVSIGGVTGTAPALIAGNNKLCWDITTYNTGSTTPIKLGKSYKTNSAGAVRISFTLQGQQSGNVIGGQIYKNGVATGTARTISVTTPVVFSEDLACAINDVFTVYIYTSIGTYQAYLIEFFIASTVPQITIT